LTSLLGIGPKTARWLAEVGVRTEAELRSLGAAGAYCRLKERDPRGVSLKALWSLHGALRGVPWHAVSPEEKKQLLEEVRAAPASARSAGPHPNRDRGAR
jgi:DNA transformation protein